MPAHSPTAPSPTAGPVFPRQTVLIALLLTAVVTMVLVRLTVSLRTHSPYVAHPSVYVPVAAAP